METIIQPVNSSLLTNELTSDKLLCKSQRDNNEIYIVSGHESPNLMQEIGRLRETAFRSWGGGTGQSVDIDDFDLIPGLYKQLIVWNPEEKAILGGYRYAIGRQVPFDKNGAPLLSSATLFHFSEEFIQNKLPYMCELGRSFVRCECQSNFTGRKNIFVLDNLWNGIMTLTVRHPEIKYFFGKVTMYKHYNVLARNLILYFLRKMFVFSEDLVKAKYPAPLNLDILQIDGLFGAENFRENFKELNKEVRKLGINIPPMFNAYMNLTTQMQVFETAFNEEFGQVEETAILINIDEIVEDKKFRYLSKTNQEKQVV